MTKRKWIITSALLAVSGALHAAVVGHLAPDAAPPVDLSAGGGQAVPVLGDSFADMVAGGATAPWRQHRHQNRSRSHLPHRLWLP